MFITSTDLLKEIRAEELNAIIRSDASIVDMGILAALEEMKSYMYPLYDTATIFAQTDTARNALLVNYAIDITIYILIANGLPAQDREDRERRYKRAIDWLKMLNKKEVSMDLPIADVGTDSDSSTNTPQGSYGIHAKRENYF